MDGFALCPDPFFLRSFLLVSFLGMGWGESRFKFWGGQGARARVILVLRECI